MKKALYIISGILLIAGLLLGAGCSRGDEEVAEEEEKEEAAEDPRMELRKVDPVLVIINNHAAARPQSGLQQASIVYEFLVEGGITRFMAVFDTALEENFTIGPVRSLRPYFAVQALEHGGVVGFAGYSDRTAELIRGLKLKQVQYGSYFWRDSSRRAPHNLYTSLEKMYQARGESQVRTIIVEPPQLPPGYEEGREVEITYHRDNKVKYIYDEEREVYLRFVNGQPHTDRESGQRSYCRRVIVRENRHTPVPGTSLLDIDLEGSGRATLYEGGRKYALRWEKTGGTTRYLYQDGKPVDLEYGNSWIQVVKE